MTGVQTCALPILNEKYSLKPVAEELSKLLNSNVKLASDVTGQSAKTVTKGMQDGEVVLLENVRFDPREEKNDDTLSKEFADLCDGIYVNDAFGAAHRAHSSTEGISHYVEEAISGFLMEKEIEFLAGTLENAKKPFVAILGGAKVSDKIGVIENLLDKVDKILIGGGMAFTFLKAKGYNIGDSICEENKIEEAENIMKKAKEANVELILPIDIKGSKEFSNDAPSEVVEADKIPEGYKGLDIGPKAIEDFAKQLEGVETILWNGPLGVCEFSNYSIGTEKVAEAIAKNETAISVVGGGDSVAAIKKLGLQDKFTHISTGGGASLELLEGKELPGLACLSNK